MKYSPSYENYLTTLFNPAQEWSKTEEGKQWIERKIPTLARLISTDYDTVLMGVYAIEISGVTVYVGESVRTVRRLICHAYNLFYHAEKIFGLSKDEVDNADITMRILSKYIFDGKKRKEEEKYYIEKLKPVLQRSEGSDECVPRRLRRAYAQTHIL